MSKSKYWDAVLEGLGSKVGMTAVMLWLVVGIYGNVLKSGHIVEGLVWLSVKINIGGSVSTRMPYVLTAGAISIVLFFIFGSSKTSIDANLASELLQQYQNPTGLFDFSALISIKDGVITGAIPEGVGGMTTVSILLIMVVAMGNLLIRSGCMDVSCYY